MVFRRGYNYVCKNGETKKTGRAWEEREKVLDSGAKWLLVIERAREERNVDENNG